MSVQSNSYIMVGVMLPGDQFGDRDDDHEITGLYHDSAYKGIQHHNGLCVLNFPMTGDRIAIGRVLAKSDDQNGNYGFNSPIDATSALTIELRTEVANLLTEHFGIEHPDVRVWVFTHYR